MAGLMIREAVPADREALIAQFTGLNLFEDGVSGDRESSPEAGEASLDHTAECIAESGGHMLVAERDGAVVAFLALCFPESPPYVRVALRRHGLVSELFVRPEARGAGVARALLAEAERLTRLRGLKRLAIGVLAGNAGAEALYRSTGFTSHAIEMLKPLD
jgi:GNAT superfamily N-acetyltransferase